MTLNEKVRAVSSRFAVRLVAGLLVVSLPAMVVLAGLLTSSAASSLTTATSAGGENVAWNTRDFELKLSMDGSVFAEVAKVTGNTADVTTHPITGTMARYARLHVTTQQTAPDLLAARIYEFEVFGVGL